MSLHESRRKSRATADGEIILLEDQERVLWDRALITEGQAMVASALSIRRFGSYTVQAAIAAAHANASSADKTD